MIHRRVDLAPEARDDLRSIYFLIADAQSVATAARYVDRILAYLATFEIASERGSSRDDLRPGLRMIGFEGRVTITFTVAAEEVTIQRIFYGGRDWPSAL